jgi:tetratricopeptide (TPR) repeat protein
MHRFPGAASLVLGLLYLHGQTPGSRPSGRSGQDAGDTSKTIAEIRVVIDRIPGAAGPHEEMAEALLAAGLGEAARAESRKAVELAPRSPFAQSVLGWVLEHDLAGRLLNRGFDYAGAEAAYRQAIRLDPENRTDAHIYLAELLEHNRDGLPLASGSRLEQAYQEYMALSERLGSQDIEAKPSIDLSSLGRFAEARDAARKLRPSSMRNYLLVSSTAVVDGPEAAIRESARLLPMEEERRDVLQKSSMILTGARLYPQAAELFAATAEDAPDRAALLTQAERIRSLKRFEDSLLPATDPRSVVQQYLKVIFTSSVDSLNQDMAALASRHLKGYLQDPENQRQFRVRAHQTRAPAKKQGLPLDVALDAVLSQLRMTVDGDASLGFRIRYQGDGPEQIAYVVPEDGQLKFLGTGFPHLGIARDHLGIARKIQELVAKGDLASARRWLDWVSESFPGSEGADPLGGPFFRRVWTAGQEPDKPAIELATAVLLIPDEHDTDAIPILKERLESAASPEQRTNIQLALLSAYWQHSRFADLQRTAEALTSQFPDSEIALGSLARALYGRSLWKEAHEVIEKRRRRLPDDPLALRMSAELAALEGNYAAALVPLRRLIVLGKATASDWNNLGWYALFRPPLEAGVVDVVREGIGSERNANFLNTMAMLYAEAGRASEARDELWQAMDVKGDDEMSPAVWLILGRIAETSGAPEAARSAYSHIEKPKEIWRLADSFYFVAQQRLTAMGKQP